MDYSKQLDWTDVLKIIVKSELRATKIYFSAIPEGFDSQKGFVFENDKIQKSIPKDLDDVLMSNGDYYPPSSRLNNIARKVEKSHYPMHHVPPWIARDYFAQYYTYLAVYHRIKHQGSVQLSPA